MRIIKLSTPDIHDSTRIHTRKQMAPVLCLIGERQSGASGDRVYSLQTSPRALAGPVVVLELADCTDDSNQHNSDRLRTVTDLHKKHSNQPVEVLMCAPTAEQGDTRAEPL